MCITFLRHGSLRREPALGPAQLVFPTAPRYACLARHSLSRRVVEASGRARSSSSALVAWRHIRGMGSQAGTFEGVAGTATRVETQSRIGRPTSAYDQLGAVLIARARARDSKGGHGRNRQKDVRRPRLQPEVCRVRQAGGGAPVRAAELRPSRLLSRLPAEACLHQEEAVPGKAQGPETLRDRDAYTRKGAAGSAPRSRPRSRETTSRLRSGRSPDRTPRRDGGASSCGALGTRQGTIAARRVAGRSMVP